MKEYVLTLIGSALVCSLVSMIAPEGKLGKYLIFAGALCILCIAVSPIYSFVSKMSGADYKELANYIFGEYNSDEENGVFLDVYKENLLDASAENMSGALKSMLCRDMKLDAENIEVYVELVEGEDKFLVSRVRVVLYDAAIFCDPGELSEYIYSLLGCECEIIYG